MLWSSCRSISGCEHDFHSVVLTFSTLGVHRRIRRIFGLRRGAGPGFERRRMLARRLTQLGIEQFDGFLTSLRDDPSADAPLDLLTESTTSEPIDVEIEAEVRRFRSRLEIAEYLSRLLRLDTATLRTDAGFWCWLALYWFETLCPVVRERWKPGNRNRWLADLEDPRKSCRHFLAGPFQIYRAHRDDPRRAMSLLCGSPTQPGPLVQLIASRPSLVTCNAVVGVATRLYYDASQGRNRPGLNAKSPGSPRRFADVLSQLDLTWDLHSLSIAQLLNLLPAEFDKFHRTSRNRQRPLIE